MRGAVVLLLVFLGCSASVIEFVSLPSSVTLPSSKAELRTSQLAALNANILGLTAKQVSGFEVKSDLFSRPRAVAIFRVDGVDSLGENNAKTYKLDYDRIDITTLDEGLASLFGADRETVTINSKGASGSAIAQLVEEQQVKEEIKTKLPIKEEIKTKLPILHKELELVYGLAAAIESQKAKFDKSNAPDVYRVTISGLSGSQLSKEEHKVAVEDIRTAVDKLAKALDTVYGGDAVVEVLAMSSAVNSTDEHVNSTDKYPEQTVIRRKRAADMTDTDKNLKTWREMLNVYVFVSTDYPAMFAIFAGLTIILVLAVLYTVVGMMSMDPSKDSIIYRMTTTRMKKA